MLPCTLVATDSGVRIERKPRGRKKRWITDVCRARRCNGHSCFIEALESIFAGRMTIQDVARILPLKGTTLENCIEENKIATLNVLRNSWMLGYIREHAGVMEYLSKKSPRSANYLFDRTGMRNEIKALLKLQEMIHPMRNIEIWWCLEEAIQQFKFLLEYSKKY